MLLWHTHNKLGKEAHWRKNQLFIQKLSRTWCLKKVNFVKNETLKMWILWKIRFSKCEFFEKWDFENVNFVKNETLIMWFMWKMRFWKCEFCEKFDFQIVDFWINWGVLPQCEKDQNPWQKLWLSVKPYTFRNTWCFIRFTENLLCVRLLRHFSNAVIDVISDTNERLF